MSELLNKTKLFNLEGNDSKESQQLIGGNPTGILNLNNVKYKWVSGFWKTMLNNFWIPEKISLVDDKISINSLTDYERKGLMDTLGFLIFLDSMQVNNLPNIADYITCSGCKTLLTTQAFQEAVHSQSYQYLLESLFSEEDRNKIYDTWRENETLRNRNEYIASQMQDFVDNPTKENFNKVLIVNLALEGVYFYQGFNFFDQLASRSKLVQSQKMIDYIRTDENSHVALFTKFIHETMDVHENKEMIYAIMGSAGEQEIKWSQETYGNDILGISEDSSELYIKYLVNQRLKGLRLDPLYPEADKNPYSHLDVKARGNFFETSGMTDYSQSAAVEGWDDF